MNVNLQRGKMFHITFFQFDYKMYIAFTSISYNEDRNV